MSDSLADKYKIPKVSTGINGFDDITRGGFPAGRPSLICGPSGSGKTILSLEFIVKGVEKFNEPGVFISFEETTSDLVANMGSLEWDLEVFISNKQIGIEEIILDGEEIEQAGSFDLNALFLRMERLIDEMNAKRMVIDSLEGIFTHLPSGKTLRNELRKLFKWIKEKGITTLITAEAGRDQLTRYGFEEYISDCVITLDKKIENNIPSRKLRVVKYRGSSHGENEYPFLINEKGVFIVPITSMNLDFKVGEKRFKSGINRLDTMLSGKGFFKGSSILISGTAGTGKTTFANTFLKTACERGERSCYCSFEESYRQIIRNMKSVGLDMEKYRKKDLLRYYSSRPTTFTLEQHLINFYQMIEVFNPEYVVIDPVSNLTNISDTQAVKNMLTRLIDFMKARSITGIFTNLLTGSSNPTEADVGISSLMDSWILLNDHEIPGEMNKTLYILKSKGMTHSNQIREYIFTSKGIELMDVYIGPEGVLTGTARLIQEAREEKEKSLHKQEIEQLKKALARKVKEYKARQQSLQTRHETDKELLEKQIRNAELREKDLEQIRKIIGRKRGSD